MHLDEGTIHAWLDGALDAEEAARVEQHAAACEACAGAIAEARGLVAGASRILTALDGVPGGIVPKTAAAAGASSARRRRSLWATLHLTPARAAAAAVVVLAAGTALVLRNAPNAARTAIKLAAYPVDSAVILQPATPMVVPHARTDTAASRTPAPAREAPLSARVATKKAAPQPVPVPSRRAVMAQGGEGRVESVPVAQKESATARSAVADNAVRGGAVDGAARAAAAPPSAAARQYSPTKGIVDARSVAGCYSLTTDSAITLPRRLRLDSAFVAQPAMLQRAKAAADAAAFERYGVSEIGTDARRSIGGAYWMPRPDGSIRLALPASALDVDLQPTSTSTLVGTAVIAGRTVAVTLRRAECGP